MTEDDKPINAATDETAEPTADSETADKGRFYWLGRNVLKGIANFYRENRVTFVLIVLALLVATFIFRAYLHPIAILTRRFSFLILIILPIIWFFRCQLRYGSWRRKALVSLSALVTTALLVFFGQETHYYLELYFRYIRLNLVELEQLPISDNERIQPRNSVFSLAHEVMSESETPMRPDFIRYQVVDNPAANSAAATTPPAERYNWTIAIEPAYPISRFLNGVRELYNVSGTAPSPSFSKANRVAVNFQVGENLLWGRKSSIATIRNFGLWRFFNYEPADVTYITDDSGQWVEVISLIRWRGVLFPYPEFGGVQLVRQQEDGIIESLKRAVIGSGEWIAPEEIANYPFLQRQNILPYAVSRHIANSFRFQGGLLAPLPGYHLGDIRIPDLPGDYNDQPFTGFFNLERHGPGMLYQYFALEPYDPEKLGLNTSLFIPADGSAIVYVYKHHQNSGSLVGVSSISDKVKESKKHYDWSRNRPVEHRPVIRDVGGKRRFFWLTTVVTLKEDEVGRHRFIAGSVPELALTDAEYSTPVWVNSLKPDTWMEKVTEDLGEVWGIPQEAQIVPQDAPLK